MSAELSVMERKMEALRKDVTRQLDGVRVDIRELTKALRDLIRLDGNIKNVTETVHRMTNQLDDIELRLREVEKTGLVANVKMTFGGRVLMMAAGAGLSVVTGVITYMVTR